MNMHLLVNHGFKMYFFEKAQNRILLEVLPTHQPIKKFSVTYPDSAEFN